MNIQATLKSVSSGKNGITISLSDVRIDKNDLTRLLGLVDEVLSINIQNEDDEIEQLAMEFPNI